MHKLLALMVLSGTALAANAVAPSGDVQAVGTLATANYSVVVTRNCPKAALSCAKVRARIKTKDGREYLLSRGSPFAPTAPNAAPGSPSGPTAGYRFTHKKMEYIVLESGDLTITRRGKTIAKEQGSWSRQG